MTKIILNGEQQDVTADTVADVLVLQGYTNLENLVVAVAQNNTVVPRAKWRETVIAANDKIDIVKPFAGG